MFDMLDWSTASPGRAGGTPSYASALLPFLITQMDSTHPNQAIRSRAHSVTTHPLTRARSVAALFFVHGSRALLLSLRVAADLHENSSTTINSDLIRMSASGLSGMGTPG